MSKCIVCQMIKITARALLKVIPVSLAFFVVGAAAIACFVLVILALSSFTGIHPLIIMISGEIVLLGILTIPRALRNLYEKAKEKCQ